MDDSSDAGEALLAKRRISNKRYSNQDPATVGNQNPVGGNRFSAANGKISNSNRLNNSVGNAVNSVDNVQNGADRNSQIVETTADMVQNEDGGDVKWDIAEKPKREWWYAVIVGQVVSIFMAGTNIACDAVQFPDHTAFVLWTYVLLLVIYGPIYLILRFIYTRRKRLREAREFQILMAGMGDDRNYGSRRDHYSGTSGTSGSQVARGSQVAPAPLQDKSATPQGSGREEIGEHTAFLTDGKNERRLDDPDWYLERARSRSQSPIVLRGNNRSAPREATIGKIHEALKTPKNLDAILREEEYKHEGKFLVPTGDSFTDNRMSLPIPDLRNSAVDSGDNQKTNSQRAQQKQRELPNKRRSRSRVSSRSPQYVKDGLVVQFKKPIHFNERDIDKRVLYVEGGDEAQNQHQNLRFAPESEEKLSTPKKAIVGGDVGTLPNNTRIKSPKTAADYYDSQAKTSSAGMGQNGTGAQISHDDQVANVEESGRGLEKYIRQTRRLARFLLILKEMTLRVILALFDVEANYLTVCAFQYTNQVSVSLILSCNVPFVMFLSWLCFSTKYMSLHYVGATICLGGLGLTITSNWLDSGPGGNHSLRGDMMALGGSILYSLSNTLQETLLKESDVKFDVVKPSQDGIDGNVEDENALDENVDDSEKPLEGDENSITGRDADGNSVTDRKTSAERKTGSCGKKSVRPVDDKLTSTGDTVFSFERGAVRIGSNGKVIKKLEIRSSSSDSDHEQQDQSVQARNRRSSAAQNDSESMQSQVRMSGNIGGGTGISQNRASALRNPGSLKDSPGQRNDQVRTGQPENEGYTSTGQQERQPSTGREIALLESQELEKELDSLYWHPVLKTLLFLGLFGTFICIIQIACLKSRSRIFRDLEATFRRNPHYKDTEWYRVNDNPEDDTQKVYPGVDLEYPYIPFLGFHLSMLLVYTVASLMLAECSAVILNLSLLSSDAYILFYYRVVKRVPGTHLFYVSFSLTIIGAVLYTVAENVHDCCKKQKKEKEEAKHIEEQKHQEDQDEAQQPLVDG